MSYLNQFKINIKLGVMILQWGLILSVTSVSVTMLMIVGAFLAILPEAQQYFQVNRTWVLLLCNIFNIGYIVITPLIFNLFRKYYVKGVLISTIATGIASIGRYLAGQNYNACLFMTAIVAIAHIPIITAPYGLLKLFPDWQKGYAASIPLFLPVLGINFCILYGLAYIADDGTHSKSIEQVHSEILNLNGIIALIGILSTITTVVLILLLKDKIQEEPLKQVKAVEQHTGSSEIETTDINSNQEESSSKEEVSFMKAIVNTFFAQKRTAITIIAWGSIVGINWTYGALFGIIFDSQSLTGKEIALIGLAANLSSAIFSNLGTFIKNRFNLQNMSIIEYLNICGIVASVIIELSRYLPFLQNLYFLIFIIIILRAGFSSFVALAFVEMEKEGMNSLIVSGFFFWVANVTNLVGMEMVDLAPTDLSLLILTVSVGFCVYTVRKHEESICPI